MAITDWPSTQRPRERLIQYGAQTLSDGELLAILLRVGVKGKSAVDLGCELTAHFGSLHQLLKAPLQDFCRINGLGPAKFAQLQAILELGRRFLKEKLQNEPVFNHPKIVKQYLQLLLSNKPYESFTILFLDVQNRLICCEELFRGTLTHINVYPREILKVALTHNAASLILAHNHPTGTCQPSNADLRLTQTLIQTLGIIDIRILDHFIVTETLVYSFSEHGQL